MKVLRNEWLTINSLELERPEPHCIYSLSDMYEDGSPMTAMLKAHHVRIEPEITTIKQFAKRPIKTGKIAKGFGR